MLREKRLGNNSTRKKETLQGTQKNTYIYGKKYKEFDERIYYFLWNSLRHTNKQKYKKKKTEWKMIKK